MVGTVVRGDEGTIIIVYSSGVTTTSATMTNSYDWAITSTSTVGANDPMLEAFARFRPRRARGARREPPRPTIDPWMPRKLLTSRPIAWPAQLRRFRGDVR